MQEQKILTSHIISFEIWSRILNIKYVNTQSNLADIFYKRTCLGLHIKNLAMKLVYYPIKGESCNNGLVSLNREFPCIIHSLLILSIQYILTKLYKNIVVHASYFVDRYINPVSHNI